MSRMLSKKDHIDFIVWGFFVFCCGNHRTDFSAWRHPVSKSAFKMNRCCIFKDNGLQHFPLLHEVTEILTYRKTHETKIIIRIRVFLVLRVSFIVKC